MGDRRGGLRESDHLEDPGVDRWILKWVFKNWGGGYGLDSSGSGEGHVAGPCEYGIEPSGSIKCEEFLD
jgi:hypothetical protein